MSAQMTCPKTEESEGSLMEVLTGQGTKQCIKGDRVDNLYDREVAERAEIHLLTKVAKLGFRSFSLAWLLVDRQWQIVAFAE